MSYSCFYIFLVSLLQKRLIEIEKRKKQKELKEQEKELRKKQLDAQMQAGEGKEFQMEEEGEEEEDEPLPEIFIPSTPCQILCGFYSEPGKFWVSLVSKHIIHNFYLSPNLI